MKPNLKLCHLGAYLQVRLQLGRPAPGGLKEVREGGVPEVVEDDDAVQRGLRHEDALEAHQTRSAHVREHVAGRVGRGQRRHQDAVVLRRLARQDAEVPAKHTVRKISPRFSDKM